MTCHFLFIYFLLTRGLPVWITEERLLVDRAESKGSLWITQIEHGSRGYRVVERLLTQVAVVGEFVALKELSVGVKVALTFWRPVTGGFHEQVAVKLG